MPGRLRLLRWRLGYLGPLTAALADDSYQALSLILLLVGVAGVGAATVHDGFDDAVVVLDAAGYRRVYVDAVARCGSSSPPG